jgi:hypothetical protein
MHEGTEVGASLALHFYLRFFIFLFFAPVDEND